jgi:hypothetical protein
MSEVGRHSNATDKPWTLMVKERGGEWRVAFSGSRGQIAWAFGRELAARTFVGAKRVNPEGEVVDEEEWE